MDRCGRFTAANPKARPAPGERGQIVRCFQAHRHSRLESLESEWTQQNFRGITILLTVALYLHFSPGKPMKIIVPSLLAATFALLATSASAQFAKPEDAIKYRQSALFVMQQNFSRVAAMASGKQPFDAKLAADSAAVADFMSKLPWVGFAPGTDKGQTKAKPEIWTAKTKFDDYAVKMQAEMSKLAVAAKSGNLDAIKTAVNATGGACKSCHDDFRAK